MLGRQFSYHNDPAKGVNDAMARAAKQWSDAAQFSASLQHEVALQDKALQAGLQIKKMEIDRDNQKYNVLSGLLRSATGLGGFRIDGKGVLTDL